MIFFAFETANRKEPRDW